MIRRIRSSFDRKRRSRRKESAADASSLGVSPSGLDGDVVLVEDESTPLVIESLVAVVEANKDRSELGISTIACGGGIDDYDDDIDDDDENVDYRGC